jgi:hypothetical protein
MTIKQRLYLRVAAIGMFVLLASAPVQLSAQTAAQTMFAIDDNDIGGVVTGANGPEAGVWVIAETNELPTKYAKMVVTDDLGRYVIPDLPTANYSVWVRGYGLVDSPKLRAKPGQHLDLKAVSAPNESEAAHYYPAIYWYHLVSFDRRKCKSPLNGPKATGDHCPEGFSFYKYPGPGFEGLGDNSAESSYYTWVDQHNTLGLGENIPMSTANLNDGFVALKDGQMVMLRIPYPMGFYAKGLDGRIDDPNAGWKGRGLWSTSGDRTPWLMEGGKGAKPRAVHIQLRPDPLAH